MQFAHHPPRNGRSVLNLAFVYEQARLESIQSGGKRTTAAFCSFQASRCGVSSDSSDTILLTIFLKHDQSKNLDGIQGHLAATGWWERFPPPGVEIVSWNVVMGIGQIVTLRLPPRLINAVNVEIERCAWGAFSTEFFPTYDFVPVRERLAREWREARNKRAGVAAPDK